MSSRVVDADGHVLAPLVGTDRIVFTSDAQLVTLAGTFTGPEAIAGFYRDLAFTVDDLWPDPGPLLVSDDRVAVEIRLRMNDNVTLVGDFFTLAGGQISRLVVYTGPPAP